MVVGGAAIAVDVRHTDNQAAPAAAPAAEIHFAFNSLLLLAICRLRADHLRWPAFATAPERNRSGHLWLTHARVTRMAFLGKRVELG
jgi:hypothetical protein